MKSLQNRVNIVPVIAKADSLTKVEIEKLKSQVMNNKSLTSLHLNFIESSDY